MIYESRYWNKPLKKLSKIISRAINIKDIDDDNRGKIEREIMVGFFAIRKLCEAELKLSSSTMKMKIDLQRYVCTRLRTH